MSEPQLFLEQISTRWPLISDPARFVLRYAPAIHRYLAALIKDSHLLEDVLQDFLLQMVQQRFEPEQVKRGRFRDYLKACVRNAALTALRRRRPVQADPALLTALADPDDPADEASRQWRDEWRQTLLARAWDRLLDHQEHSPGNHAHRVLRLYLDHPSEDSAALAARLAEETDCRLTAEAFRQQLSRARRRFAELLVEEVRQTLEQPGPEFVEAELADLELLECVRPDRLQP
jgi:RNA polymerase sigma factor (sigma-70 family)